MVWFNTISSTRIVVEWECMSPLNCTKCDCPLSSKRSTHLSTVWSKAGQRWAQAHEPINGPPSQNGDRRHHLLDKVLCTGMSITSAYCGTPPRKSSRAWRVGLSLSNCERIGSDGTKSARPKLRSRRGNRQSVRLRIARAWLAISHARTSRPGAVSRWSGQQQSTER